MRRAKENINERRVGGILSKFLIDLSQKGEPCEDGISNPLSKRV